jgi:hypothetical protein
MKSQKAFVVDKVKEILGSSFTPFQDKALLVLTNVQLEQVKSDTFRAILSGAIEYGKDLQQQVEVRTYARSMVMNHLKKAKELNGNLVFSTEGSKTIATKVIKDPTPKGVDLSLLPEDLRSYVSKLV